MVLTLRQAAEEVGMTKPAVLKAIQKGKLSATKDGNGQWQIDPAELFRAYPPLPVPEPIKLTIGTGKESSENERLTAELKAVSQENALLREFHTRERQHLEDTITDLRRDRDHWRQQATAILPHQPESASARANHPTIRPVFWALLAAALIALSAWLVAEHWGIRRPF